MSRLIPMVILLIALGLFFYFRLDRFMSLSALQQYHHLLKSWVTDNLWLTSLGFMSLYIIATAVSIPGGVFFTMAGGFLFGPILGTAYVVVSATIGASILFWAAKTAFADTLRNKAGQWLKRLEHDFNRNAASYLLCLRLVPIFPFWLVNIVPALLGLRTKTFIWTTAIGIIPGSLVYVLLGNSFSAVLRQGQSLDLSIIFKPVIFLPLLGLALLSLLPIVFKKAQKLNDSHHTSNP